MLNSIRSRPILRLFSIVSWLGNYPAWVALGFFLWLADGNDCWPAIFHLAIAAVVSALLHRLVKSLSARPRPFDIEPGFHLTVKALDEFSFPSGHTVHAVAYTMVLSVHYPIAFWCVLPFTLLVAMSRVVLGLHYPSDVLMGAALGAIVALAVIQI